MTELSKEEIKAEIDLDYKCLNGYLCVILFLAEILHDSDRLNKKEGKLIKESLARLQIQARSEVETLTDILCLSKPVSEKGLLPKRKARRKPK